MQTFENQTVGRTGCAPKRGPPEKLDALHWAQNETIEDLEFINCELDNGGLVTYGAPVYRSTARNLRLKKCRLNSFFGIGAVFDELVVDGLRVARSPAILNACAFRHVLLTGQCGQFLMNRNVCFDDEDRNAAFHKANAAFYETVDWALDISNVRAACIEIRGSIPARLIRRNPDEQVIMTREVAQSGDWKRYDPPDPFQIGVSIFLDSGAADDVFVAARRSKYFKEEADYFHRLRAAGLVM